MQFPKKEFYEKIKVTTLGYWRNPTKAEIKFGYGAIHHRDFELDECFTKDGYFKYKFRAKNDGLLYYAKGYEHYITRQNIKKEDIEMFMPEWV